MSVAIDILLWGIVAGLAVMAGMRGRAVLSGALREGVVDFLALIPRMALSEPREDIAVRSLSPAPPVRRVIAATPYSARLVPAAGAMLGILEAVAAED